MVSTERIYQHIRKNKKEGEICTKIFAINSSPISGKYEVIKNNKSIDLRPEIVFGQSKSKINYFQSSLP